MATETRDAPDWEGRTLLDRSGERVGTIEEIYLVEETDRPQWALVKLGRIAGGATPVPRSGAVAAAGGVRAACEKSRVREAPRVDGDDGPSDEQVAAIYRHYGLD